jgi:hypothetical protein
MYRFVIATEVGYCGAGNRYKHCECTALMMDEMFDTNVEGYVKMGHKAS